MEKEKFYLKLEGLKRIWDYISKENPDYKFPEFETFVIKELSDSITSLRQYLKITKKLQGSIKIN